MKRLVGFVPCFLAALGLVGFATTFVSETDVFRASLVEWAGRDLGANARLAAETLREPLATGDFRRLRAFAEKCRADGVRLTVFARPGGVLFDSDNAAGSSPVERPEVAGAFSGRQTVLLRHSTTLDADFLYAAQPSDDFVVRLSIPTSRVFAPLRRARTGFLFAGVTGACGILMVFLFWGRLLARVRRLSAERDANRKLLAEMKRVENFRRDFIANVSHEIRTPLTGILGATDLLEGADDLPPEDRRRLLGMLRSEATRLNSLSEQVLSLARLERDEAATSLSLAEADLADLVRGVADRFRDEAAAAGAEISVSAPEEPVVANCDAGLLEQALANLVRNAILHASAKRIEISAARRGAGVVLAVADDGVGIAQEHLGRLFERFYRVDEAREGGAGGSGLGLAIVRQIARLHGGDVSVDSAPGRGSRFEIALP